MEGLYLSEELFAEGEGAGLLDLLDIGGHAFADAGDFQELFGVVGDELLSWMVVDSTASAARR